MSNQTFIPTVPPGQGAEIPRFKKVPAHVAMIMDGNGRWANQQGLPRTEGHKAGELALMDTLAGALEAGVKVLSVYAFSTENWKRSAKEVAFLMGYSRDVIRRRAEELHQWNVKIIWSGRRRRLWTSVIQELDQAGELTQDNTGMIFNMCINYGGRAELVDACVKLGEQVKSGSLDPGKINEDALGRALYQPDLPEVDLVIRTSGEQRLSNFLLWEAAYAQLAFVPEAWPDFNRQLLWREIVKFGKQDRRFGGAIDRVTTG